MDLRRTLAECPLFADLAPGALDELTTIASPLEIRGGERLFNEGDSADLLYIVSSGRLRASIGEDRIAGFIGRLEPVGEFGLISGEVRTATVHAVRDSVLIQIPRDQFLTFLLAHPTALVAITRILLARMRQNQRQQALSSARSTRAFAILPASARLPLVQMAKDLAAELGKHAKVRLMDVATVDAALGEGTAHTPFKDSEANRQLMAWLGAQEREHEYLLYCTGHDPDAWARRCMRQVDRILVVADAADMPVITPMIDSLRRSGVLATIELVLLRPAEAPGGNVAAWRSQTGATSHHFLRPGDASDLARLARMITGRSIGLVLGGGGARGFAHIGMLRALEERKVHIDLAGGSSMGAFISALLACGYNSHEMLHVVRDTFVRNNYLNDYMFPRIALIRGRKFFRRLCEIFGDREVEHLRIPWFCISSNLTRGEMNVHDKGPLEMWLAASMAVPGIAPPVVYKGDLLADGSVANSLPTDVMLNLERGPIIASNVSTEGSIRAAGVEGPDPEGLLTYRGPGDPPNLRDILFRTATMTSESGTRRRAAVADVYLRMPVSAVGMFEWKRLDEIVERGYEYACERLDIELPRLAL